MVEREITLEKERVLELDRKHVLRHWWAAEKPSSIVLERGKDAVVYDIEGKEYLDFLSELYCVNAGHSNERILAAMSEQAKKICFSAPWFSNSKRAELAEKIAEITPGRLSKSFFTPGGSESNEIAAMIARLYSGKSKILSRWSSYHGGTYGAMAFVGMPYTRMDFEAYKAPGNVKVLPPYCYRCPFNHHPDTCSLECAEHINYVIEQEMPSTVAAVLIEAHTGSAGGLPSPEGYLKRVREICDKHEVLLIADEVLVGFGRTGKMFACDNWGLEPDIMTMAKGLTSAYIPLGAAVMRDDIGEHFLEHDFRGGFTYGGHTLACAVGVATIETYFKENLIENAAKMGEILHRGLKGLAEDHPCVGEARGKGLIACLELVKNKETKEPLIDPIEDQDRSLTVMDDIMVKCMSEGMILGTGRPSHQIMISPPLCVNREQVERSIDILDAALSIGDRKTR